LPKPIIEDVSVISKYPAALLPNAPFAKLEILTPFWPSATVPVT
jgi:hypothetical protein